MPQPVALPTPLLTEYLLEQLRDCEGGLYAMGDILQVAACDLQETSPVRALAWAASSVHAERCWPAVEGHGLSSNLGPANQPEYIKGVLETHPHIIPSWAAAIDANIPVLLKGHLADILLRLHQSPDRRRLTGVVADAWRSLPGSSFSDLKWLLTALHHARCIKAPYLNALVADALRVANEAIEQANRELEETGRAEGIGIPLHVLALLVSHPAYHEDGAGAEVRSLLDRADRNAAGRPFGPADQLAKLRAQYAHTVGDHEARRSAQAAQVEVVAFRAELGNELHRVIQLQGALKLAEGYGLTTEAQELRSRLERAAQPVYTVYEEEIEMPPFHPTSQDRVTILAEAAQHLISETHAGRVHEAGEAGGLLEVLSTTVIGPRNNVVEHVPVVEHLHSDAIRQYVTAAHLPGLHELIKLDDTDAVAGQVLLTERLDVALRHVRNSDFDEAVHILVPRIEAALRDLCSNLGVPVTVSPTDGSPGRERTLSFLGALKDTVPAGSVDAIEYLSFVLTSDDGGLNLRNRIAHGTDYRLATFTDAAVAVGAALVARSLLATYTEA